MNAHSRFSSMLAVGNYVMSPDRKYNFATCSDEQTAQFFAAAPDLLAALEAAIIWAEDVPAPYREWAFIKQARAAIARAKGKGGAE